MPIADTTSHECILIVQNMGQVQIRTDHTKCEAIFAIPDCWSCSRCWRWLAFSYAACWGWEGAAWWQSLPGYNHRPAKMFQSNAQSAYTCSIQKMGVAVHYVVALDGLFQLLRRVLGLSGDIGVQQWASITGVPEGCTMSITAMLAVSSGLFPRAVGWAMPFIGMPSLRWQHGMPGWHLFGAAKRSQRSHEWSHEIAQDAGCCG